MLQSKIEQWISINEWKNYFMCYIMYAIWRDKRITIINIMSLYCLSVVRSSGLSDDLFQFTTTRAVHAHHLATFVIINKGWRRIGWRRTGWWRPHAICLPARRRLLGHCYRFTKIGFRRLNAEWAHQESNNANCKCLGHFLRKIKLQINDIEISYLCRLGELVRRWWLCDWESVYLLWSSLPITDNVAAHLITWNIIYNSFLSSIGWFNLVC